MPGTSVLALECAASRNCGFCPDICPTHAIDAFAEALAPD